MMLLPDSHCTKAPASANDNGFVNTRWTLIRWAGGEDSGRASQALEELCTKYWPPVYGYIRKRGHQEADAQNLTQDFFCQFLGSNPFNRLSPERGRFRAYLLQSAKYFLANEHKRAGRQKRGGGVHHLPIDWSEAEERYAAEASDSQSPEKYFDQALAIRLLEVVLERLAAEYSTGPEAAEFALLRPYLTLGESEAPYEGLAARLKITSGTARTKVNRLRARFRELLRQEVARTCEPEFLDEELQALRCALAG